MKFLALAALASLASSISIELSKRESPLDVKLEMTGNTELKASVTNTGSEDLKVLKTGSFLDETAVEKVEVFQGSSKVAFEGIKLRISTTNIPEEAFQVIAAGQTVETSFDVAQMHDLTAGGAFDIVSSGTLSYAKADSTELTGVVSYSSNTISASVNGAEAAKVRRAFLEKRSYVSSDCTGSRRTATVNAMSNCRSLALAASSAAGSNNAKLQEYFKSTTSSTRSTVQTVFNRVATECGTTSGGYADYYCTDVYGACGSNVLAYTLPSQSFMVNCPLYFSALSALSSSCHAQDQATTTLHEVTHLTQIRGTQDYGYGYSAVQSLSSSQNLNNADTYALFANAIYAGC
ncbi:metallo proteinase [Trematosphaeria pertusa]|uniref:Neutral protease 2 n=1 Tax=Trematosphaeria pertusa TaxID=390896 RepID=A0A6A6I100_9PLEO|nr:metallo proteinase [Trematosphaeria pertusa]KAF2244174.1 metallo proteinase [Trematosphaeria pertusa]